MTRFKTSASGLTAMCFILAFGQFACPNGGGGLPDPSAGLYHTYAELDAEMHALAASHPGLAQIRSLGQSVEGRELWALKISDNAANDEDEAAVALLGGHHAREWISIEVPLKIAQYLLENYASDTAIKNLVDQSEIWIVPMVNPDGHHYSVVTDRLWRKNRRNNGDGTFGVDLNRNYAHEWGGPGSSGSTYSDIYRGPSPFSEPETQAVRDFLQQRAPKALISYHSYSQLVLYPWGHTNSPAPDAAMLQQMAVAIADEIRAVNNKGYTPQQSSELYLASGDTTDWLYALLATPSFTIELRPRGNPGFELPETEIQPTYEENLPAALYLIDWAIQQSDVTM